MIIKESFRIIVHVSFGLPRFLRSSGVHLRATCGSAADGMPCPSNSSSSTTSHLSQNTVDPQDKQKGVENTPLFHTRGHAEGLCKLCVADDLGLEVAVTNRFNMTVISRFGQQQLVMVIYACGFIESETGKYFE